MSGQPTDLADLERPILDLEAQIRALEMDPGKTKERDRLRKKVDKLKAEVFASITDWQRTQLARHPRRPYTLDYIERICDRFEEIHGDRNFADDAAIVGGMGWIGGEPVMVIGQQKGRDTKQKIIRNFGMPRPEGYRKARRLFDLAARFQRPVITFIDTPGAYPGIGAEERGQAEAIAVNLEVMASLPVPVVAVVIGEGGSGGALALGVANRVLMLEYSIYSVISPESCSAILYRDAGKAQKTAEALRLTARDLLGFGITDEVIPEAPGGAHRDPALTARSVGAALLRQAAADGAGRAGGGPLPPVQGHGRLRRGALSRGVAGGAPARAHRRPGAVKPRAQTTQGPEAVARAGESGV